MPLQMPDAVLQGLGLMPPSMPQAPQTPPQLAPAPMPGQPPALDDALQGPPGMRPNLPPMPQMSSPPAMPSSGPAGQDFQIPIDAIDGPGSPGPQQPSGPRQALRGPQAQPPPMQRPSAPGKRNAYADAMQDDANRASQAANAAEVEVQVAKADQDLAAYNAAETEHRQAQEALKTERDAYGKTHAVKLGHLQAARKQRDDFHVDRGRYEREQGVGDKLRWGIAMILSSVGNAMQGNGQGAGPILEMLQNKIKEDVAAQMDQRDELDKQVGGSRAALDEFDAFSKDRQAQILARTAAAEQDLARKLRLSAAKVAAPDALARGAKAAAVLEQSAAEKEAAAAKRATDAEMDEKKLAEQRASRYQSDRHFGISSAETKRHNLMTEETTQQQRDIAAIALTKQGKDEEAKLVRERALGGEVKPIKDANGKVVGSEIGLITKKDGSVWIPNGTEPNVTALQKGHQAKVALLNDLSEIKRLGPEWLADSANSDKLQKLQQVSEHAKLVAKDAFELGVIAGPDLGLINGVLGGAGAPTVAKVGTIVPGINQAIKTLVDAENVVFQRAGLDKRWEYVDLGDTPKAEPTAAQKIGIALKAEPDENPSRARDRAFNDAYRANGGDHKAALTAAEEAAQAARSGRIDPGQRKGIETLKQQAISGDAEALETLRDVLQSEDTKAKNKAKTGRGIIDFATGMAGERTGRQSAIRSAVAEAIQEIERAELERRIAAEQAAAGPTEPTDVERAMKRFRLEPPNDSVP